MARMLNPDTEQFFFNNLGKLEFSMTLYWFNVLSTPLLQRSLCIQFNWLLLFPAVGWHANEYDRCIVV
jgi:hypothetical protein